MLSSDNLIMNSPSGPVGHGASRPGGPGAPWSPLRPLLPFLPGSPCTQHSDHVSPGLTHLSARGPGGAGLPLEARDAVHAREAVTARPALQARHTWHALHIQIPITGRSFLIDLFFEEKCSTCQQSDILDTTRSIETSQKRVLISYWITVETVGLLLAELDKKNIVRFAEMALFQSCKSFF